MARWVRTAIAGLLVVGGCGRSSPYSATTQESRTRFTTTTGGPPPAPTTTAGSARQSGHWQAIDAGPLATRSEPRAVWTGNEVVVVGGLLTDQYQALADGAAFDPARGTWRRIPDRPAPGRILVAVWTGEEVVTFATDGLGLETLTTGFAFNPATNRWRPVPLPPSSAKALLSQLRIMRSVHGNGRAGCFVPPDSITGLNLRSARWEFRVFQ